MIGRRHHVVIDCRAPGAMAAFYSELLTLPVTYQTDDYVVISENETTGDWPWASCVAGQDEAVIVSS